MPTLSKTWKWRSLEKFVERASLLRIVNDMKNVKVLNPAFPTNFRLRSDEAKKQQEENHNQKKWIPGKKWEKPKSSSEKINNGEVNWKFINKPPLWRKTKRKRRNVCRGARLLRHSGGKGATGTAKNNRVEWQHNLRVLIIRQHFISSFISCSASFLPKSLLEDKEVVQEKLKD